MPSSHLPARIQLLNFLPSFSHPPISGDRDRESMIEMERWRVVLKGIENKINSQVIFAMRSNGLLKKAYKLSILCEADIALFIISNRGKLYEFCNNSRQRNWYRREDEGMVMEFSEPTECQPFFWHQKKQRRSLRSDHVGFINSNQPLWILRNNSL